MVSARSGGSVQVEVESPVQARSPRVYTDAHLFNASLMGRQIRSHPLCVQAHFLPRGVLFLRRALVDGAVV